MTQHNTAKEILETMLGHLGFVFEIQEENRITGPTLHIRTRNSSRLIGRDGKTLEDLQFLLNRVATHDIHDESRPKVMIDIENYRLYQQQDLLNEVKHIIDHVRQTGETAELPPLNSFDRRIVHLTYKADPDIETVSPESPARLKCILVRRRTNTPSKTEEKTA